MKRIVPSEEVMVEPDRQHGSAENGIVVPIERINPDTLRSMAEEFVTRDWSELTDSGYSLEEKIRQVIRLLKDNRAKVVYDHTSETCNIVAAEQVNH